MVKDDNMKDIEDEHEDEHEEEEEHEEEDEHEDDHEEEEEEHEEEDGGEKTKTKNKDKDNTNDEKKKSKRRIRVEGDIQLPVARIKRIMRCDKDVKIISSDAVMLVAKSTEMFLDYLVKEAYKASGKKKTLQYKDLASTIKGVDNLDFLSEIIPEKVSI
ncbi:hypothetical protein ACTFIZ_004320 [Dictyostelium cf. discoideum]